MTTKKAKEHFAKKKDKKDKAPTPPPEPPQAPLRIDFWFVPHGYQVDVYEMGKMVHSECRDFGGDQDTGKLKDLALNHMAGLVKKFRRL